MKKYLLAPFFILLFTFYTLPARADWLIDRSGSLVQVDGTVLGEEDSAVAVTTEVKEESVETQEKEKKQREHYRQNLERQIEARKKVQERTGQTATYEVKSEANKLRIKQEIKNREGKTLEKREIELKPKESLRVEGENGEHTRINSVRDGMLEVAKEKIKTRSEMEVKVDEKNEILVTLPNGKEREVKLPDQALTRLVENGVISKIEGDDNAYELVTGSNGEPVYKVDGQVEKKLFGLFKLKFAQKIEVAASSEGDNTQEVGDVVNTESRETGWRRFLERLSR